MLSYTVPLLPGRVYHLFNHAVGEELLFRENTNYVYFLNRMKKYFPPVVKIYAYTLMPNHFHFVVKIQERPVLLQCYNKEKEKPSDEELAAFVMQQFSNMFNGYAKAYNKRYERRGALFIDYLKRREVLNMNYFKNLICYVHCNAVHHQFCNSPYEWIFSSYAAYFSDQETILDRATVLNSFNGLEDFLNSHKVFIKRKKNLNFDNIHTL